MLWTVFLILLLSYDVELNPGPVRFPCSVCYKPVHVNQQALQCDNCVYWCHCVCCGVDSQAYAVFQNAEAFGWICPKCVADIMPFHDCSVLSSVSESSSVLSSLTSESSNGLLDLPPLLTSGGLRVAHLNCRSLLPSAEEVYDVCTRNSIDIFAVTETWLDTSIDDQEIFPFSPHINIVRNDSNRHGGGVAFILSDRVKYVLRSDLCEGRIESLWIELFPATKRSMLFCCVYRPPSQHDLFDAFLAEYETAHLQCPSIAIFGDVNADLLKPCYPCTKLLLSVMKQLQLVDLVCTPTRVTMDSSSQIDVLLTTDDGCFNFTKVFPFSGSDHHLIVSRYYPRGLCVDPPSHQIVVVRNFQKLDTVMLDKLLTCDDIWDDVLSKFDNVSECLECFNLIMNGLLDLLVPLKKLRVRQRDCPWLSSGSIAKARHLQDVAHRKAVESGSAADWSYYKSLRNKANSMLRSAKATYFKDLASSLRDKPSKFWRHFQSLSRRSGSVGGNLLSVTADAFNNHFLSIPFKTVATVPSGTIPVTEYRCIWRGCLIHLCHLWSLTVLMMIWWHHLLLILMFIRLLELMVSQLGSSELLLIW